jgi:hypothetical protein
MATEIKKTLIGTPDSGVGGLTLCNGLSLFPPFPTLPLGWQSSTAGSLQIGKGFQILAVRASASAGFSMNVGLCGPSYAIQFETEGEVDGDTLTLSVEDDEAMAGFFLGAGLEVEAKLSVQLYKLYWHWGIHGRWSGVLNVDLKVGVDVLKAAIDIIAALLQIEDMIAHAAVEVAVDTPLQMIGEASKVYALSEGQIDLHCQFTVPINLWTIAVLAAAATVEVPFLNVASVAIIAVHEALDVTLSAIGFGPTLGLDVPVNIQIKGVTLDDVKFDKTKITDDGKWQGTKTDPAAVVADPPEKITFTMEHTPYLDFTIGLYAELQLVELFHVGASVSMDVLGIFNIEPALGTYTHTLTNTIGRDYLAANVNDRNMFKDAGMVNVELA